MKLRERGNTLAWFAIVLLVLTPGLLGISYYIPRALYVRNHLQAATDAACQAAVDSLVVPVFLETGQSRINPAKMYQQAAIAFNGSLSDSGRVRFTPSLRINLRSPTLAECHASATLASLFPWLPPLEISARTQSEMRVRLNLP
jgi:Flp pilus assembly protein TadG